MILTHLGEDEGNEAVAELAQRMAGHVVQDIATANRSTHLLVDAGSDDFVDVLHAALAKSIAEMPNGKLLAMVMGKVRNDRRQNNEPVLPDDELPPGFSSN